MPIDLSILETPCCDCRQRRQRPYEALKMDGMLLAITVLGYTISIANKHVVLAVAQMLHIYVLVYQIFNDSKRILEQIERHRLGEETESEASSANTSMTTESEAEAEQPATDCSGRLLEELSDDGSSTDSEMPSLEPAHKSPIALIKPFLEPDEDDHLSDEEKQAIQNLLDLGLQNDVKED